MSYHGLGAEPCKIKSYEYDSAFPQLSDGKGCPAGMNPLTHDLGVTGKVNGDAVCTTRVSCTWDKPTTAPPVVAFPPVIAPPVSPPVRQVQEESVWDSYGGILVSTVAILSIVALAKKSGFLPCPTTALGSSKIRRRSLPPTPPT
jgi:hypothetical protein